MVKASIITPSYPCSKEEMKEAKKNLEKMGFDEIEDFTSKGVLFDKWAGSFQERLDNLYSAWNSDSGLILCCKGGSGMSHLLPLIKTNRLRKRKILVGYSDITLLLNFISKKLRIVTIHGPNGSTKMDKKSLSALKDAIEMRNYGMKFAEKQCFNMHDSFLEGRVVGGNLERFVEFLGYFKLDLRDKILFLEESNLTEHRIFNLLVSLKNKPSFKPKALVFGDLGVKNKKLMKEMILSLFQDIPLILNMEFGHTNPNIAFPIGSLCRIDFSEGNLKFIFSDKDRKYSIKT
jgi:muramoyltetrapeptide carboxypeptidase